MRRIHLPQSSSRFRSTASHAGCGRLAPRAENGVNMARRFNSARNGLSVAEILLVTAVIGAVVFGLFSWNTEQEFKALAAAESSGLPQEAAPPFNSVCQIGNERLLCTRWSGRIEVRSATTGELESSWDSNRVERLAASATSNGLEYVIGNSQGQIEVWTADGMSEPRIWQAHDAQIDHLRLSADNKSVYVVTSTDGFSRWDLATGTELQRWKPTIEDIRAVEISPDEESIVVGSSHGAIHLVNLKTSHMISWLPHAEHHDPAFTWKSLKWNPLHPGELIAVARTRVLVLKHDALTLMPQRSVAMADADIRTSLLQPEAHRLLVTTLTGAVQVWDTDTWQQVHEFQPHKQVIRSMTLVADGRELITAG